MKIKNIDALAEIMEQRGLTEIEITEEGSTVRLCRKGGALETVAGTAAKQPVDAAQQSITAPMVGVYYSAPEPGAEQYVREGQAVKRGDVLCIVEAMKMMNEILCEKDCIISKILCNDGQLVEYGQPLFYTK